MPVIVYVFHNPRDKRDYVSVGKTAQPNQLTAAVIKECQAGSLFGLQFALDYQQPLWQRAISSLQHYFAPNAFIRSWSGQGEILTEANKLQTQVFNIMQDVTQNKQRGADRAYEIIDAYMRN